MPLINDMQAGLTEVAGVQTLTFDLYVKLILPLDGFVFWVKADLCTAGALSNAMKVNGSNSALNQSANITIPATNFIAKGSIHYSTSKIQDETESYGISKIIFNSEDAVHQDFYRLNQNIMYIATFRGLMFAFANRSSFYVQSGIYHYTGDAIYPFMKSQIINNLAQFNSSQLIVSNSLPIWLGFNNYQDFYGFGNDIPLYPAHLVKPNVVPPFASVNCMQTDAVLSVPYLNNMYDHYQLVRDTVRIVFYGVGNDLIMNFVDCTLQYMDDYPYMGLMNCPVVRDEKTGQNELNIIAQKKSITYEVSYHQKSIRGLVRQIICRSIQNYEPITPNFSFTVDTI